MKTRHEIAHRHFGLPFESLDPRAKKVTEHIADRKHISRNVPREEDDADATLGQRAADAVASFGGSWVFIGLFACFMTLWIGSNVVLLARRGETFDPYPFILLNLFLSMLAAIQAPIILMSQNRQSQKDRANAEHDYEVNLKAEIEIMMLHEKIDYLREHQWGQMVKLQEEQLAQMTRLFAERAAPRE